MTLPTSGTISLTLVINELRIANSSRTYPISLGDSDVRTLAGKPSGAISLSDLYGKSATPPTQPADPMTLYPNGTNRSIPNTSTGGGSIAINLSVAVTGGARPLTYLWTNIVSSGGMTQVSGIDGPSLNFERTYAQNSSGSGSASAICTVTDANGVSKSTGTVSGTATWGTPA